ncbi:MULTISPECIES: hypothetical protein [Methylobacterium]|jgi:hypothetical protein|uniref:Uncharacterized protein n=1 Tax=Methylobacterium jeotgali TaxID=381630 RepID=A0ABQ4SYU9_9HYPH|nr:MULTISPECIES: hypothetical protein [Methylobacterium]PIU05670.1 MAG: hypothetical protein COT56_13580 [Methylobacterium sp. CG09_land_8_20_14_0_10_71_15]PIU12380.1 MAG: hypothetical protein COT28_15425 [Methylobacterium sp. CG08_land_8_20_14_0_20_71_15]GBU16892.1 hypothetical protein AwMethylo_11070 [Methylobacterium sp.]GJE06846.1 hypothetical protein AOPFMNJM_2168 [Methylobacterium jeotgali]
MANPKKTLADFEKEFPVGKKVRFSPGRGAADVTAEITGVRQAGTPGTRGYSVFIDTVEHREGGLKPLNRSARPGTCTLVD